MVSSDKEPMLIACSPALMFGPRLAVAYTLQPSAQVDSMLSRPFPRLGMVWSLCFAAGYFFTTIAALSAGRSVLVEASMQSH